MKIQLINMFTPYELKVERNENDENFIRIRPNSDLEERNGIFDLYDICLDHDNIVELIKTLQFMLDFVKD